MADLPGVASYKKLTLSLLSAIKCQRSSTRGGILCPPSCLYAGVLSGWSFSRSCEWCHKHCAVGLLCPGNIVSSVLFTSVSYNPSLLLEDLWALQWGVWYVYLIQSWALHSLIFYTLSSWGSLCWLPSTIRSYFDGAWRCSHLQRWRCL